MVKMPKEIGIIPIGVFLVLVWLGYYLDPSGEAVYNPPYLLTILNIMFVTGTGVIVAILSARSYLKYGNINILLLGCATLAAGFASLIGGYSANFVSGNYGVTTHNVNILLSSVLQFVSAMITIRAINQTETNRRPGTLIAAYSMIVLFVAFSTALTYANDIPVFLAATGPTAIRQTVLALTVAFFVLSSLIFYRQYIQSRSRVLFWYSLGLGMFAIGMVSLIFQVTNGDFSSWIGRFAQYAGGVYFLIALLSLRTGVEREAGLSAGWAETFRNDRRQFANFFATMLNGFMFGRIVTDKDGKPLDIVLLDVNDAFERITGMRRDSAIDRRLTELLPEIGDDSHGWVVNYGRVAQSGNPAQFESHLTTLKKWLNVSAYSPQKGYFVAIFEDITERKRAEEALQEINKDLEVARARLQAVLNQMPLGMFIIEAPDGRISFANEEVERMFRTTFVPTSTKRVDEYPKWMAYWPDGRLLSGEEYAAARSFKRGEIVRNELLKVQRGDGTWFWIETSSAPVVDSGGNTIAAVVMAVDVTARVNDAERLEEQARDLTRSNEELQQFAYVASHDMQEPLRMISVYLGLLNKKFGSEINPAAKDYMNFINAGADRMRQLISDLLQYSRIDAQEREFIEVDMNTVAETVKEECRTSIEEANAEVVIDLLPAVHADEVQIKQLLTNLVSNAIKFHSDRPPRVEVSAVTYDGEFVFSVKDNGIGIDPRYADKLFKMFQRLHTRDEYPGTGIGLAISKKIVERHGGKIWFESEVGKGTTFYFTLPVRDQPTYEVA